MVLGIAWPWAKAKEEEKGHKTVHIFLGFFFVLNFCVGTGFLGIPYSFFYSGYPAVIPTFLFVAGITWINSNYLLEIMARAQVNGIMMCSELATIVTACRHWNILIRAFHLEKQR